MNRPRKKKKGLLVVIRCELHCAETFRREGGINDPWFQLDAFFPLGFLLRLLTPQLGVVRRGEAGRARKKNM